MGYNIRPLTYEYRQAAFDLATEMFVSGSTLHKALSINLAEYREYLSAPFDAMIAEGHSLVAIDSASHTVLGCLIATDFKGAIGVENSDTPHFAPLSALTNTLCEAYLAHHRISAGEALLVDMAVVAKEAAGLGIYQNMREEIELNARQN